MIILEKFLILCSNLELLRAYSQIRPSFKHWFQTKDDVQNSTFSSLISHGSFILSLDSTMYENDQFFSEFHMHYLSKRLSYNPNDEVSAPTVFDQGKAQVHGRNKYQFKALVARKLSPLELPGEIYFQNYWFLLLLMIFFFYLNLCKLITAWLALTYAYL